jgi:hypothetical protein
MLKPELAGRKDSSGELYDLIRSGQDTSSYYKNPANSVSERLKELDKLLTAKPKAKKQSVPT